MPSFAIDGGVALVLARGMSVMAGLSAFGTLLFWAAVVPRSVQRAPPETAVLVDALLLRLSRSGLAAAAIMLIVWLVLQAGDMANAATLAGSAKAAPVVLFHTSFGHVVLGQWAALAGAASLLGRGRPAWRRRGAASLAGIATALQAFHGHALAMTPGPSWLLLSGIVHLLAAGGWLGGLVPLLLLVRHTAPRTGAAAARWFSPLGQWCVAGVAGSALFQAWSLVGTAPGLIGTGYGWLAMAKLALLGVLLAFATWNRYRLAPALLRAAPESARTRLVRSVFVQTGFGLLVVLAASTLSSLPPAVHEQPLWPFSLRPSLAVLDDPDLAREVGWGALGVAGAIVALGAAVAWRRMRRVLLGVAIVALGAAAPHLGLLLVEAYPTSYDRSPTGFAAAGIARGAALFQEHCASCHGVDGGGGGPLASALPVPPADLTAEHLWEHSDGELFWWLSQGIEMPGGGLAMPGFAGRLSDDDRWALIDYVRANNAGLAMRALGSWPHPVQAPDIALTCAAGPATSRDLAGRMLLVVAGRSADAWRLPSGPPAITAVSLTRGSPPAPVGPVCAAPDPAAWTAFATLAGVPSADLEGTEFLVDADGWLRDLRRPGGQLLPWNEPAALMADARRIAADPIRSSAPSAHLHH